MHLECYYILALSDDSFLWAPKLPPNLFINAIHWYGKWNRCTYGSELQIMR